MSPVSPHDSLSSPSNEGFNDHYAILELSVHASDDDIRAAYRKLRVVYFQSDAKKYRALQAAFDTLMDPEARQAYDANYCPAQSPAVASIDEIMEQPKHERKDSGHSVAGRITAMAILEEEEEVAAARDQDPNWALKRHQKLEDTIFGSEPYPSFVPVLQVYQYRTQHPLLKCRRPTYTGDLARNAWPN